MAKYKLRITSLDGISTEIDSVEEFVSGYRYLYVRTRNTTMSFERDYIESVARWGWDSKNNTTSWIPVLLRKPRI